MINDVPMTLIGRPTLPANNYAELVKWLEANKGKINLANAGLGAASHLCGLLFQQRHEDRHDDRAVQGHRAGHDRPDRRPGRPHVRPDHQHQRARSKAGKVKAFAVTTRQAPDHAGAGQGPADAGRIGPEGLQRDHLARPVRAQGHAQGGAQDQLNDRAAKSR